MADRVSDDTTRLGEGDTEAHGFRTPFSPDDELETEGRTSLPPIPDAPESDTEAHGARLPLVGADERDTEGHGRRPPAAPDDEPVFEGSTQTGRDDERLPTSRLEQTETDVEGHGFRGP